MVVGDLVQEADVMVIGSGPGGYVAAIRAAQLGRKVMLVERGKIGGVCLNRGCIPSKAMISAASKMQQVKEMHHMGIGTSAEATVDMSRLMAWKNGIVTKLTGGIETLLKGNNVEVLQGDAYFSDTNRVRVVSETASQTYQFQDVIIATGSRPFEIKGVPFDKKRILSSTELLNIEEKPEHLLVIGGGYIGLELGTAFAKMGSKVTILEGANSLLPGIPRAMTQLVSKRLKKLGVEIFTSAMVKEGANTGSEVEVTATVNGEEKTFSADYCLVAVGRTPNTDDIGLEQIGLKKDDKGFIEINEQCKSNIEGIYAIGDCAGGALLAHKACYEGKVAAEVIAGKKTVIDYRAMPFVIFSDPEISYTGLNEAEAKEKGYEPLVIRFPFAANGRALTTGQGDGFVQIIAEKETRRILGAQMVGPQASDLIAEVVLAIELGATAEDLSLTIHAHPTLAETVMEASEGIMGNAIHMVNSQLSKG